jgi:hypothetical protein
MAKHTPQSLMGHPDGAANITPPHKVNDPKYQPALGNIAAQLTGPASNRTDPGGSEGSDPLDGQYETNSNHNLF